MRIFLLIISIIILQNCTSDPTKYELKSPCVAADGDSAQLPCKRRPINLNTVTQSTNKPQGTEFKAILMNFSAHRTV